MQVFKIRKIKMLIFAMNAFLILSCQSKNQIGKSDEQHIHKPVYGKSISRSNAKAIIVLLDAKGKSLEPYIVNSVQLQRNYRDDLWIWDYAKYDNKTSSVTCNGFLENGLEPGDYLLEIDGGGYGTLKINFKLNKNEKYRATYKMPNHSKVIEIKFVDENQKSLEYISHLPKYLYDENESPFTYGKRKGSTVLKSLPKIPERGNSFGQRRIERKNKWPYAPLYKTRSGSIYIRVFANQSGEIRYWPNSEEGGYSTITFKGNFNDTESICFILNSNEPEAELITKAIDVNKKIKGKIVPYNIEPFITKDTKQSPAIKTSQAKPFQMHLNLTTTLNEMAKNYSKVHAVDNFFDITSNMNKGISSSISIENEKNHVNKNINLSMIIQCYFPISTQYRNINYYFSYLPEGYLENINNYPNKNGKYFVMPLQLSNYDINKENYEKPIEAFPNMRAIVLRIVGNKSEGLPLVEASLILDKDLETALTIRKILLESVDKEYLLLLKDEDFLNAQKNNFENETYIKLKNIFGSDDLLQYFIANGAWYNTSSRSISDSAGYLILKSEFLKKGEPCTLFFWNQSTDDLKPDFQKSFVAADGITDLGAILVLPKENLKYK